MNQTATFGSLDHTARLRSAQTILNQADIVFLLWPDGEIADVTFGPFTGIVADQSRLRARQVMEIAEQPDRDLLQDLVTAARLGQRHKPVRLTHTSLVSAGTRADYSAHLAGDGKNIVLIGRLRAGRGNIAERVVDTEIARAKAEAQRASADRYRFLFEASSEGVLIVDAETDLIEEANGNASRILGVEPYYILGSTLSSHFLKEREETPSDPNGSNEALSMTVTLTGSNQDVRLISRTIPGQERPLLLVRLIELGGQMDAQAEKARLAIQVLFRSSVPIALTGPDLSVVWSNGAFAGLRPSLSMTHKPLTSVLGLSETALDMAVRDAREHGRTLTSLSALDGRLNIGADAHVTLVSIGDGMSSGYGFLFYPSAAAASDRSADTSALAELVGKAPMKVLVRRSTDEIERHCIEAALNLTDNNRTLAADVLGLSRQSLYMKLRQFGLD